MATTTPSPLIPRTRPPVGSAMIVRGMSVAEIARRVGTSQSYMSRVFNGTQMPSSETLHRIAACIGASMDHLYRELQEMGRLRRAARSTPVADGGAA